MCPKHRVPGRHSIIQHKLQFLKVLNGIGFVFLALDLQRVSRSEVLATAGSPSSVKIQKIICIAACCARQGDRIPRRIPLGRPTPINLRPIRRTIRILQYDRIARSIPKPRCITAIQVATIDNQPIDCQRIMMHISGIRRRGTDRPACNRVSRQRMSAIIRHISARHIGSMDKIKKRLPPRNGQSNCQ